MNVCWLLTAPPLAKLFGRSDDDAGLGANFGGHKR
jgi:hypothetical protein